MQDRLIRGMVWAVAQEGVAEKIAQHTVEETQLGNYDGKYLKIFRKTRATLMDIIDDKSVGVIEEDKERNLVKIAKPVGVIGALSPSTNPEATPVIKAICAVKGRNSIIVCPHPRAKITNKTICDRMRDALVKLGVQAQRQRRVLARQQRQRLLQPTRLNHHTAQQNDHAHSSRSPRAMRPSRVWV